MLTPAILVLASLVACASVVAVRIRNASQNALIECVADDASDDVSDFMIGMDRAVLKTGAIKAVPFDPSVHLDVAVPHVTMGSRITDLQTVSAPRQIIIGKSDEKATVLISREIVLDDVVYSQDDEDRLSALCSIRMPNGRFRAPNLAEQQERDALIDKKMAWKNGVKVR